MAQQPQFDKHKSKILISGYIREVDEESKGTVLIDICFDYFYSTLSLLHSDRVAIDYDSYTIKSKVSMHDTCFVGDWLDMQSMHSFHFRVNEAERYVGIGLVPKEGDMTKDVCVCTHGVYAFYTNGNVWINSTEVISREPKSTFKAGDEGTVYFNPFDSTMTLSKNNGKEHFVLAANMNKTQYKWAISVCFDVDDSMTILSCS